MMWEQLQPRKVVKQHQDGSTRLVPMALARYYEPGISQNIVELWGDPPLVQRQDGAARCVGRVGGRPGRVLDGRKLLLAPHLQQRHVLRHAKRVEDEKLQLDALRTRSHKPMLSKDLNQPSDAAGQSPHAC